MTVPTWRNRSNAEKCARLADIARAGLEEKTPEAIAARAEAAEARRLEREAACLAAERPALNGQKRRALSRMPV